MRRNIPTISFVVDVAERGVFGRLQPQVDRIHANERLNLVRVVKLLQKFGNSVCGSVWPFDARICNVEQSLRILTLVFQTVVHCVIDVLIVAQLFIIEHAFPLVGPALSVFVPDARTRLRISIPHPRYVILSIACLVYLHARQ